MIMFCTFLFRFSLLQMVPSEVLDLGRQLIAVAIGNESVDEVVIAEKFESQVLTA